MLLILYRCSSWLSRARQILWVVLQFSSCFFGKSKTTFLLTTHNHNLFDKNNLVTLLGSLSAHIDYAENFLHFFIFSEYDCKLFFFTNPHKYMFFCFPLLFQNEFFKKSAFIFYVFYILYLSIAILHFLQFKFCFLV